jgi:hypothetical protein
MNALRAIVVAVALVFIGQANAAEVTHDILATYTQKSVDKWGVPTLHSKIATSVASANKAHADSGTGITLRILSFEPSLIQESGNFYTTHNNLRASVATKTRRDQIGADIVLMVTEDPGCGGAASLWWTWNPNLTMLDSFAVVTSNTLQATASSPCAGDLTVAHEFGHAQGLLHDRESEPVEGLKAGYHFGYKVCTANGFRTVMSYKCPSINVPQLARFSDPTASYNGIPMGIAYETAPYQAADAVRQLKKNAPIIANFRNAVVPMPPAPPTLTLKATPASVAAGGASSLSWSSYAADQCTASGAWSGPRLTSGTESTGSLSASKTFTISCTGPGGSATRSATVSVAAAPAPTVPGTPQNLRVTAVGPSVTLTWDPADSLAASFVILRSKVGSTGGQTAPQATGTVTVPTFTQTVAAGTWRYWVYARNSKGGSAHAGPVDITVS